MAKLLAAPSKEILEVALQGLEAQRAKLDEQISHVRALLGHSAGRPAKTAASSPSTSAPAAAPATKKRTLSAEARKRIAAAQKKRWAAFRKTQK